MLFNSQEHFAKFQSSLFELTLKVTSKPLVQIKSRLNKARI